MQNGASQRGSIILVYSVIVSMMVAGAAVTAMAFTEYRLAQRTVNQAKAFYLAEGGLDTALVNLRSDPTYTGAAYAPVYDEDGNEIGGYEITVTELGDNQLQVSAEGRYPADNPEAAWYATNTVEGTVSVGGSPFTAAVFANTSMDLNGNNAVIDSYDSRDGAYSVATAGDNGDVGTNGTSEGV